MLDLGCGTGRLARWLGERLGPKARVVGVDPLEERIAVARAHGGAARFEVGRAEDLSGFEDASFDAVLMASVFHWVSDQAKALSEIRRVLRPGGRLGLTTVPRELAPTGTVAQVIQPLLQRPPYSHQLERAAAAVGNGGCTSTELVSLALASGLQPLELHVTQRLSVHPSGEAFVDFAEASSFGNLLQLVPEQLRAAFRAELVSAFDGLRGRGGVAVRGWELLLTATLQVSS